MARLLILWLLAERPLHGYQVKRILTDDGMAFWFGLEDASIYSVLRTLAKNGYATELEPEQEGNRPLRTRYAITPAGRVHYRQLLREAISTVHLPMAPIDVALAAAGDLPEADIQAALTERAANLRALADEIDQHRRAAPNDRIPTRTAAIVAAEIGWLTQLTARPPKESI